ncbi:hypothetical protein P4203_14810 [Pseudomonas aeruginosa]|nr:hypothetical protein [Pseudomonas aeruginosa]
MRQLARRLAIELGFQASELERMTLGDLLWWLAEGEEERRRRPPGERRPRYFSRSAEADIDNRRDEPS